ncbi:MAG: hypothetical protein N5P05_003921 [Chroococcopsis gigantea SAG 12.99]|jgi:DNA phosphorothioation-associated putative methyltransferase|nr:DNA phosphorothioation-associated putative methyltransferase [Chlorogloea purpurea SAG 13.99]MDV3002315.1 hypothetical protein [Chroococcopsis gigantea SAG 12.99]
MAPLPVSTIVELCQQNSVGKLLKSAFYIHHSALTALDPKLQEYEREARSIGNPAHFTLIKFAFDKAKVSYLDYPEFDTDPHPALSSSLVVDVELATPSKWEYKDSHNPPILHRKETFVTRDYPLYDLFSHLTACEEALGLLDNSQGIGTRSQWLERLKGFSIGFSDHYLICPIDRGGNKSHLIERHRAAIVRKNLSRPVRLALESGLFTGGVSFFDYGCGHGEDIKQIEKQGFTSDGYDPYYRPDTELRPADIVNLGYVINVIEDREERQEALLKAWQLTHQVLIVSAQVLIDDRAGGLVAYEDGIITRRNTFQKYYQQEELKDYIDNILGVDSIPIGLGIYLVFREESRAEAFRLSRLRCRATTPRVKSYSRRFEDYENILTPLMEFYTERGRLPKTGELENEAEILQEFNSFRRAFAVVLQVTAPEDWDEISEKCRQELTLYLALTKFGKRPRLSQLSATLQEDIKSLFGSYQRACLYADSALLNAGKMPIITEAAAGCSTGRKSRDSLTVHISALDKLPLLLRLYEACASRVIGSLEDANVVKFSLRQPQISYLYYRDFEGEAHPILQTRMDIDLAYLRVRYRDYHEEENPPLLHEKERLVTPEHPDYEKFAKLSQQERDRGLLDDFKNITHRRGWLNRLEERGVMIQGHRIFWRKDLDPYRLKLLRSQLAQRKATKKAPATTPENLLE